jgi:hypothetical protein
VAPAASTVNGVAVGAVVVVVAAVAAVAVVAAAAAATVFATAVEIDEKSFLKRKVSNQGS